MGSARKVQVKSRYPSLTVMVSVMFYFSGNLPGEPVKGKVPFQFRSALLAIGEVNP